MYPILSPKLLYSTSDQLLIFFIFKQLSNFWYFRRKHNSDKLGTRKTNSKALNMNMSELNYRTWCRILRAHTLLASNHVPLHSPATIGLNISESKWNHRSNICYRAANHLAETSHVWHRWHSQRNGAQQCWNHNSALLVLLSVPVSGQAK